MTFIRRLLPIVFACCVAAFLSIFAFSEWLIRSSYASVSRDDVHWYHLKAASGVRYISDPMAGFYDLDVHLGVSALVIGIVSAWVSKAFDLKKADGK